MGHDETNLNQIAIRYRISEILRDLDQGGFGEGDRFLSCRNRDPSKSLKKFIAFVEVGYFLQTISPNVSISDADRIKALLPSLLSSKHSYIDVLCRAYLDRFANDHQHLSCPIAEELRLSIYRRLCGIDICLLIDEGYNKISRAAHENPGVLKDAFKKIVYGECQDVNIELLTSLDAFFDISVQLKRILDDAGNELTSSLIWCLFADDYVHWTSVLPLEADLARLAGDAGAFRSAVNAVKSLAYSAARNRPLVEYLSNIKLSTNVLSSITAFPLNVDTKTHAPPPLLPNKPVRKNSFLLFGTDGLRGQANHFPITAEVAMKVAMAAGRMLVCGEHRHRVVIGKDTRLSGYMIESAMTAGFTSVGTDVFLLGPVPTPAVAMLTRSLRADLGVMISASHNPFQDNGIKIFDHEGYTLSDRNQRVIEDCLYGDISGFLVAPEKMGRAKRIDAAFDRYIEYAKRTLDRHVRLDGLKVVIDCANGAAYKVAPQLLWELGANVITIGDNPNGFNVNHDCGSTAPASLCKKVRETGADMGIALDGDADRVILVSEHGEIIDGDQILAVIAESWLTEKKLAGGGVVATVMSNLGLERFLRTLDLGLLRTPVGDRYVVEQMRYSGCNLGGEQSGHIVMSDYTTTGDGLVTALQILSVVVTSGKPVSEVCKRFDPIPQLLRSVRTPRESLEYVDVRNAIEENRLRLGNSGRLLIRPSATEPIVRVMAEGDDADLVRDVVDSIAETLEQHLERKQST